MDFDPTNHTYTVDGQTWPHVTGILRDAGLVSHQFYTDWARERGSIVHRMIGLDLEGVLDETTVDPLFRGYRDGWRRFRDFKTPTVVASEFAVVSRLHRYCGTIDDIMVVDGRQTIWDLKTGEPGEEAGWQLAGYSVAYEEMFGVQLPRERYVVQLFADGRFKIHPYRSHEDWRVFYAALTVYYARRRKGMKEWVETS